METHPLFWKEFFLDFFGSKCRRGLENTFGEKNYGPSYQKLRDLGRSLGTCLV